MERQGTLGPNEESKATDTCTGVMSTVKKVYVNIFGFAQVSDDPPYISAYSKAETILVDVLGHVLREERFVGTE